MGDELLTRLRRRPVVVAATGTAVMVALHLPFATGARDDFAGVPGGLGALVAVVTAILAGPLVGTVVASAGWAVFFVLVADRAPGAALALPVWGAAAIAAGFLSERVRMREVEASDRIARLEPITQTVLRHLDVVQVLDELLDRVRNLLDTDTAVMLLLDDDGETLVPRAAQGLVAELEAGVRVPVGQGFAGRVAAEAQPVMVEDVQTYPLAHPFLRHSGLRSLLGVPLLQGGDVIGVLHTGTYRPRVFTADDALLMQLVADRVASAVAQSRLYEAERAARATAERVQEQLRVLAEASEVLASSLDYELTLKRIAELAVQFADEVFVDIVAEDGSLQRLAVAHADPAKAGVIQELAQQYPPDLAATFGPGAVVRTGTPQLVAEVTPEVVDGVARDQEHRRAIVELGLESFLSVPLLGHERVLGALTFISASPERRYDEASLAFAQDLARRAAVAIENARLYRTAQERAHASVVLDHVGEGVFLVDMGGIVRLWNRAAEALTGIAAVDIVGRPLGGEIPGWAGIDEQVPISGAPGTAAQLPATLPLDLDGREHWLLIAGVRFPEGTVYAFRDVTEERGLRELQAEFVATISHELRTPLAAVYGAAMTLQQRSSTLDDATTERLLAVVFSEASRLSRIIDDVLWASRLDSGRLDFTIEQIDPVEIAASVIEAARVHIPGGIKVELAAGERVPPIAADEDKVRQVLANLLDNAVKYSPDGGKIGLDIESTGRFVRFSVRDEGLGIPVGEQARIFEKFFRLDPNQTRGVGGTGLGLYICRELVRRMNGRIWVDSREGTGSTFSVELPLAGVPAEVLAHMTG